MHWHNCAIDFYAVGGSRGPITFQILQVQTILGDTGVGRDSLAKATHQMQIARGVHIYELVLSCLMSISV